MCLLCSRNNDFSDIHLEEEFKKSSREKLITTLASLRRAKFQYEVWHKYPGMDGFEKVLIEETLEKLNKMISFMGQYL